MHHLSADAFPLKRTIYKELSNKKTIILHCALQPANVGTLDSDDADLRQRPLLAKTNRLSSPIQVQFLNDFLHSGEVQTFAIFEILSARGTKCDLHWLIRSTDDAGLQVTGWSLDFKLTHYPPTSTRANSVGDFPVRLSIPDFSVSPCLWGYLNVNSKNRDTPAPGFDSVPAAPPGNQNASPACNV